MQRECFCCGSRGHYRAVDGTRGNELGGRALYWMPDFRVMESILKCCLHHSGYTKVGVMNVKHANNESLRLWWSTDFYPSFTARSTFVVLTEISQAILDGFSLNLVESCPRQSLNQINEIKQKRLRFMTAPTQFKLPCRKCCHVRKLTILRFGSCKPIQDKTKSGRHNLPFCALSV